MLRAALTYLTGIIISLLFLLLYQLFELGRIGSSSWVSVAPVMLLVVTTIVAAADRMILSQLLGEGGVPSYVVNFFLFLGIWTVVLCVCEFSGIGNSLLLAIKYLSYFITSIV